MSVTRRDRRTEPGELRSILTAGEEWMGQQLSMLNELIPTLEEKLKLKQEEKKTGE